MSGRVPLVTGRITVSIKSRRRLVGIFLAITTPAVVAALALPASALNAADPLIDSTCTNASVAHNLVANCGFEATVTAGVIPGWTHVVSHDAFVGVGGPHSGGHALALASEATSGAAGDDDVFTQTIRVVPHAHYVIGAWVNAANTTANPDSNDFTLAATNVNGSSDASTIYSESNVNHVIGWHQVGGTVTATGASTITLVIRGANGPDHTWVDDVFVTAQRTGCASVANNAVRNCGFESGSASPWVHSSGSGTGIQSNGSYGGNWSLRFGATPPASDSWFQVVSVRPHTQYTLSYWDENWSGATPPNNNLHVIVSNVPAASGGSLKITTTNAVNNFWTHITRTFTTGSGSSATLLVTGANAPGWTYVDDFSITAVPHVRISAKGRTLTTTVSGVGGQKVELEKLVGKVWHVVHTWTAPKTGYAKAFVLTVGSGGTYRGAALAAPGYGSAVSGPIAIK